MALAQNPYGRITGRVTDAAGAVAPGATVRAVNVETNVAVTTTTNNEGNYELPNLNPGRYRLVVELAGFKRYERGPFELRVGDVLTLVFRNHPDRTDTGPAGHHAAGHGGLRRG